MPYGIGIYATRSTPMAGAGGCRGRLEDLRRGRETAAHMPDGEEREPGQFSVRAASVRGLHEPVRRPGSKKMNFPTVTYLLAASVLSFVLSCDAVPNSVPASRKMSPQDDRVVDSILAAAPLYYASFNGPDTVSIDSIAVFELELTPPSLDSVMDKEFTYDTTVSVTDLMEAKLMAPGLEVKPNHPEPKGVSGRSKTTWKWNVYGAKNPGHYKLDATLQIKPEVNGRELPRDVAEFQRYIVIEGAPNQQVREFLAEVPDIILDHIVAGLVAMVIGVLVAPWLRRCILGVRERFRRWRDPRAAGAAAGARRQRLGHGHEEERRQRNPERPPESEIKARPRALRETDPAGLGDSAGVVDADGGPDRATRGDSQRGRPDAPGPGGQEKTRGGHDERHRGRAERGERRRSVRQLRHESEQHWHHGDRNQHDDRAGDGGREDPAEQGQPGRDHELEQGGDVHQRRGQRRSLRRQCRDAHGDRGHRGVRGPHDQ